MTLESRRLLRADLDLLKANARIRELESEVFEAERRGREQAKAEAEEMWQHVLRAAELRGEQRAMSTARYGEATVTETEDEIVVSIAPDVVAVPVERSLLLDLIARANPDKVVREV